MTLVVNSLCDYMLFMSSSLAGSVHECVLRGPLNTAFLGLGTPRYGVAVFPTIFAFVLEHAHFPKLAIPVVQVKLPAYSLDYYVGRASSLVGRQMLGVGLLVCG